MEIDILIDVNLEGCPEVGWLQSIAEQVLITQGADFGAELGLVITSQERVRELNRSYRGKDEPTDVIAFAMLPARGKPEVKLFPFVVPPDGMLHLGDVVISYPQAVIQAEERQHSVKKEIAILVIHGVLHLLGYEDITPQLKRTMIAREEQILDNIKGELS